MLNAPFQSFDGYDLFPTVIEKAIRLCIGLIKNHPFHDGNKRIGAMALLITLDLNMISIKTNSTELSKIIILLASGDIDDRGLLQWIRDRII